MSEEKKETEFKSFLESTKSQDSELVVNFVSLQDARQIEEMDWLRSEMEKKGFRVENFEYKVTVKTEIRRPINPKLKNSPTERVTIEEKVNVNSNFKAVRQLDWRVLKDPENVLLLQINRAKGEYLSVPLIFTNIFKKGKPILVHSVTRTVMSQLMAKPDLKFEKIPEAVEQNGELKEQLLSRAKRKKGMQATARELMDLSGFPEEIAKKILAIATGKVVELTDAEAINIILMSDLHNRYLGLFQNYVEEWTTKKTPVQSLAKQFSDLTQSLKPTYLASKLQKYFLDPENAKIATNADIFKQLYQSMQKMDDKPLIVDDKPATKNQIFSQVKGIVVIARSQVDPELWRRCHYTLSKDEVNSLAHNLKTVGQLADQTKTYLSTIGQAASRTLLEVYLTYNIHHFLKNKVVRFNQTAFSKKEPEFFKSMVLPLLQIKLPKKNAKDYIHHLFSEKGISPQKLIHPIQFLGSAYGYMIGRILTENIQKFLAPGVNNLYYRFGKDFFEICYERVVFEQGLPVSREQFFKWLKLKRFVAKPEELGYIPCETETDYDPWLTPEILAGSGESILPPQITPEEFSLKFMEKQGFFLNFIERLKKHLSTQESEFNPSQIFLDLADKGKYNFRSAGFRKYVKGTFLYEELSEVVLNSCSEIKTELEESAINNKAILKIPLPYSPILYIGNTFDVYSGDQVIQVHLMAIPVKSIEELPGISKTFSKNLAMHLRQASTIERKGLIQAMKILKEYVKMSMEYTRFSSILVMDRLVHQVLYKEHKETKKSPSHLKHFVDDDKKLLIGNIKETNISKIVNYQVEGDKRGLSEVETIAFGQALQMILYSKNALKHINEKKEIIKKLQGLLARFSGSLKATEEWKRYSKHLESFYKLLSLPLPEIDDKRIKTLKTLSFELRELLRKSEPNSGVVARLSMEWKRRFPNAAQKFAFYASFLDEDQTLKDNLMLEIKQSRGFLGQIKTKECIIFFPEGAKEHQIGHMTEIGQFIRQQNFKGDFYVETQTLSEAKTEKICRTFYPNNFFKLLQLEPTKP